MYLLKFSQLALINLTYRAVTLLIKFGSHENAFNFTNGLNAD